MMRVVVPFTRLDPRTVERLDAFAPGWVGSELDPQDPGAYMDLLEAEWARPGDLLVIEHDIGIHRDVIPGLKSCPALWCGHAYHVAGRALVCLGCTRFRAELKAAVPDLFEQIAKIPFDGLPPRDWRRLDVRLANVLARAGYSPHRHRHPVHHYHQY